MKTLFRSLLVFVLQFALERSLRLVLRRFV
jgi:hypothetical protein